LLGVLGNKGGACIRMSIYDTQVCFVCAHLSAHREDVHKRNEDAAAILQKKIFPDANHGAAEQIRQTTVMTTTTARIYDSVNHTGARLQEFAPQLYSVSNHDTFLTISPEEHDVIFFYGDLNYRVVEGPTIEEVYGLLDLSEDVQLNSSNQYLFNDMDQLCTEKKSGKVFRGFEEGLVTFKPTYQYIPGTDLYDRRVDKKLRCPGWCDRILWRVQLPGYISRRNGTALPLSDNDTESENNAIDLPELRNHGIQWGRSLSSLKGLKNTSNNEETDSSSLLHQRPVKIVQYSR
jgi:phosphatidylinositol-bisphosphatase